jgi:hypothetical protein
MIREKSLLMEISGGICNKREPLIDDLTLEHRPNNTHNKTIDLRFCKCRDDGGICKKKRQCFNFISLRTSSSCLCPQGLRNYIRRNTKRCKEIRCLIAWPTYRLLFILLVEWVRPNNVGFVSKTSMETGVESSTGTHTHFFFPMPPHVPYGLRGLPSRLWLKCNWLLRLERSWGAVTLSRWGGWWYMKYQEGP